jgi:hypothetical protein
MENSPTQKSNTLPQLSILLQTTTAKSLASGKFEDIEKSVGMSIKDILDKPPIAMLKKVVEPEKIETFLAIQLGKLIGTVNIANNLNIQNFQIPFIAAHLIEMYPVESVEDFVLCFKRGSAGIYGIIYRLDTAVLYEWMKSYLLEKYELKEVQIENEKQLKIEESRINYEAFKERVDRDFIQPERITNEKVNEYEKWKLEHQYKYFTVENLQIYATSQQHAEELVQKMIDNGDLIRE